MDLKNMVSLDNYSLNGPGEMSIQDMDELTKALEAGQITGRDTADSTSASGAPLKVESLENTLKVLTHKQNDIVLWNKIPKLPAYNTVEEYNQLQSYGDDRGGFNTEGALPEDGDSTYVRRAQLVKFLGTTRSVSHPMQLVKTHIGNSIQQEINNGTLWILRKTDAALTGADSEAITVEFNGIYTQQRQSFATMPLWNDSDVVIDCRGLRLDDQFVEDAALAIIENYGNGTLMMAPPKVLSDYVKNFHDSKYITPNTPAVTAGVMGQAVKSVMTQFGEIELGYDKFMKQGTPKVVGGGSSSSKAPSAPTPDGSTPIAVATDTSTKFTDGAGSYFYAVSAINKYGESALVQLGAATQAVTSAQAVDLKFTATASTYDAEAFIIYRSLVDAPITSMYPIFVVPVGDIAAGWDGGAATLVRDRNRFIGGTEKAFMIEPTEEVWSFKQLAPLMKMDLAILAPAFRFMILLYGTPMLYAPKKMVQFINVGSTART